MARRRARSRPGREPRDRAGVHRREHRQRPRRGEGRLRLRDAARRARRVAHDRARGAGRRVRRRANAERGGGAERPGAGPGDRAPVVHTPTADDVANIQDIDTRIPPGTMHEDDLASVLGKEPVILCSPPRPSARAGSAVPSSTSPSRSSATAPTTPPTSTWRSTTTTSPTRACAPGRGVQPADRAVAVRHRLRQQGRQPDRGRLQRRRAQPGDRSDPGQLLSPAA